MANYGFLQYAFDVTNNMEIIKQSENLETKHEMVLKFYPDLIKIH